MSTSSFRKFEFALCIPYTQKAPAPGGRAEPPAFGRARATLGAGASRQGAKRTPGAGADDHHPPPPQRRRVPHWGPGGGQNERGKTTPPAQGRRSRRAPPPEENISITGWAAIQRRRRGERHRPAPRKREGPKTSPHHSGLGKRDAPATGRPARKGPDRPTTPPRAVLGGGAEDTEPAKGTRLAPATPGATPRPGRKEQPEEGKIPSARGGADRARATSPRNNRVGAPVFSRPPHWAARIAAPNGGRHHFRSV